MTKSYLVWNSADTIEDARTIEAVDYDEAAELWADNTDTDSGEYPIAGGGNIVRVAVQQVGDPSKTIVYFKVEGEFSASYWAYPTP